MTRTTVHAAHCTDHDDATSTCITSTRAAGHALMWAATRPGRDTELHLYMTDPDRPWTTGEWDALLVAMRALRDDATC